MYAGFSGSPLPLLRKFSCFRNSFEGPKTTCYSHCSQSGLRLAVAVRSTVESLVRVYALWLLPFVRARDGLFAIFGSVPEGPDLNPCKTYFHTIYKVADQF